MNFVRPVHDAHRAILAPKSCDRQIVAHAKGTGSFRWRTICAFGRACGLLRRGIVSTPGAVEALTQEGGDFLEYLTRHVSGDWGDLCDDDKRENELSVKEGFRILSAYRREALDNHRSRPQRDHLLVAGRILKALPAPASDQTGAGGFLLTFDKMDSFVESWEQLTAIHIIFDMDDASQPSAPYIIFDMRGSGRGLSSHQIGHEP